MDMEIDSDSLTALRRMATHQGMTQRAMLQKLINEAQTALLRTMDGGQQDACFDRLKGK